MLGNHRDAWVFGAADASSGTAAMMELSRVLGEQLKKGILGDVYFKNICCATGTLTCNPKTIAKDTARWSPF